MGRENARVNIRTSDGTSAVWVDRLAIEDDGVVTITAQYVRTSSSYELQEGTAPRYLQDAADAEFTDRMTNCAAVIADALNPVTRLCLEVSTVEAAHHLHRLARAAIGDGVDLRMALVVRMDQ